MADEQQAFGANQGYRHANAGSLGLGDGFAKRASPHFSGLDIELAIPLAQENGLALPLLHNEEAAGHEEADQQSYGYSEGGQYSNQRGAPEE